MDENKCEIWTKKVAGARPARMSCCALALIFSAPFPLFWRCSAQPVNQKNWTGDVSSSMPVFCQILRLEPAGSQSDQELAVSIVREGSASSLFDQGLAILVVRGGCAHNRLDQELAIPFGRGGCARSRLDEALAVSVAQGGCAGSPLDQKLVHSEIFS